MSAADGSGSDGATPEGAAGGGTGASIGSSAEGAATPTPARQRWGGREYSPEEIEAAKQQWRDMRPWDSPMARADKVLIGATVAVIVFGLVSLPFRPFLLASHPVLLGLATGSLSAIGAGAAFARVGDTALWLVIGAGVIGMIKFDWLFWWAGRRWGAKGVRFFVPSERAQRFVARVRSWPTWIMPLLVVAAALPGVPSLLVHLLAGLAGMRLLTFLLANAVGAALIASLVAGLGYGLGQYAVDVVLAVDRYALWITIAIAVFVAYRAGAAQNRKGKEQREARPSSGG
jgi:membrane-associated protein